MYVTLHLLFFVVINEKIMNDIPPLASARDIAQMIDVSAVKSNSADDSIRELVQCGEKYDCYLVTMLPSQTALAKSLLQASSSPKLGGNVGFPSGGQTTYIKVQETLELIKLGVDEIDMVIDIAAHLSGRYVSVYNEVKEVVHASQGKPVKVILECNYLSNKQILEGCDIAIKAGATYVKTGTGWAPSGATLENVELIKNHVGNQIKIKASGGIRNIETLLEMYKRGATRFGISVNSATRILISASTMNMQYPIHFS
jgi:deoxyribose-phosphate aldolase